MSRDGNFTISMAVGALRLDCRCCRYSYCGVCALPRHQDDAQHQRRKADQGFAVSLGGHAAGRMVPPQRDSLCAGECDDHRFSGAGGHFSCRSCGACWSRWARSSFTSLFEKAAPVTAQSNAIIQTVEACSELSDTRTGALIVFERREKLNDISRTGTRVNADVTAELIKKYLLPQGAAARWRHDCGGQPDPRGRVCAAAVGQPAAEPGSWAPATARRWA